MTESGPPPESQLPALPYRVYGINLIVQLWRTPAPGFSVHCPKGGLMCYGRVVARGDGFDEGANSFREMPPLGALVAFEEDQETLQGHYFFLGDEEYRILPLDNVLMAYAEGEPPP